MQFGFFDDHRREYVITSPARRCHGSIIWEARTFSRSCPTLRGLLLLPRRAAAQAHRYRYNNCPLDQEGFHIYIKDGNTVWNPGWQPTKTELDRYTCRHGLGYSVIEGRKTVFQLHRRCWFRRGDSCLLIRLTLKNKLPRKKDARCVPICGVLPLGRDG